MTQGVLTTAEVTGGVPTALKPLPEIPLYFFVRLQALVIIRTLRFIGLSGCHQAREKLRVLIMPRANLP